MLKLILWKLGFEIANIRRIFERLHPAQNEVYFAFGGNLSPAVLALRKIYPVTEKFITLKDFKMSFSQPGPWRGMGFASIESAPGELVYGKLYTISRLDALRMDYYEAVPFLGRYKRVYHIQDGIRFFFYVTCYPTENLKPSREYLASIVDGLEPHVPADYLAQLKATEVVSELLPDPGMIFFLSVPGWLPGRITKVMGWFDRICLKFYVQILRRWSLTERWIRPRR